MNYADVLKARRDRLQLAMDEAALLNVEQSMQRYLWLMAVSLHDAYGFGPERLQKFFRGVSGELGRACENAGRGRRRLRL